MSLQKLSIPEQILYGGFFVAFLGETGCGKTTTMTWFAYWINKRLKETEVDIGLYSNYDLHDIPEQNLFWDYTLMTHPNELFELEAGFCFIDELWRWVLDSYSSKRNAQQQYDDICSNARKSGLGFFASSQRFMRIDPNFRNNVHYVVFPQLLLNFKNEPVRVVVTIINNITEEPEDKFNIDPRPVFNMFSTRQKIERHDSLQVDLKDLAEEFNEWNTIYREDQYGKKIPMYKQKVTQSVIDLFLTEKKMFHFMTKDERKMFRALIERENL